MATLSQKVLKEVSYKIAKYLVGRAGALYGAGLNYKINVETALIPNQVWKTLGSAGTKIAYGLLDFVPTFSTMVNEQASMYRQVEKVEKIAKNPNLSASQKENRIRPIIDRAVFHSYHRTGLQSFIGFINFLIPIPFVALPPLQFSEVRI